MSQLELGGLDSLKLTDAECSCRCHVKDLCIRQQRYPSSNKVDLDPYISVAGVGFAAHNPVAKDGDGNGGVIKCSLELSCRWHRKPMLFCTILQSIGSIAYWP